VRILKEEKIRKPHLYIEFNVQKDSYDGCPLKVLENGHATGALNVNAMRWHILEVLKKVQN